MKDNLKINEKLKSLARDDTAYNELLKLFSNSTNSDQNEFLPEFYIKGFDNYFWFIKNLDNSDFDYYSDAVEKITGYSISELEDMKEGIFSIIKTHELSELRQNINDLLNDPSDKLIKFSFHITTKSGETVNLFATLILEKNKTEKANYLRGFAVDISDLNGNNQEIYSEVDRLTKVNAQKDKFISIVSHDLRTPFTSLLGFSEILLNDNDLSELEKREFLEFIYDASKRQLQMVNYLLDWSRLQSGKMTIELKRVNLRSLISNSVSVLTGAAIRKGVEIKVDIDKKHFVTVDERLGAQCISNLLSNAIKFTPKGKMIYVTAEVFKKGLLEIIVKDEGLGISDADQSKLFKIDEKLSLVGTAGEKGSGLGLMLVKEIVEKHKGEIWFYSKLGEGSEFHITFPEAENVILVVEDDIDVRKLYVRTVKESFENYKVLEADNGYEAMTIIIEKIPSLIVSDHNMPLMNGIQLVETMKKKYLDIIPIIVISSFFDELLRKQYNELGVTNLITKPINLDNLLKVINETILD